MGKEICVPSASVSQSAPVKLFSVKERIRLPPALSPYSFSYFLRERERERERDKDREIRETKQTKTKERHYLQKGETI